MLAAAQELATIAAMYVIQNRPLDGDYYIGKTLERWMTARDNYFTKENR